MKTKNFNCLKMTREISYMKRIKGRVREFADTLVKEAHKSLLWKSIIHSVFVRLQNI